MEGRHHRQDKLDGQDASTFLGANQKAADAEKLDGLDSTNFAAYKRTVLVSPVGTPAENGTALKNALGGISDTSASNTYLVKIEPGTYDVGSADTPLAMKHYVDVEGSGEGITTITASGSDNLMTGTVVGAADAELRSLTVKSSSDLRSYSVAIFDGHEQTSGAKPFHMTDVTATATNSAGDGVSYGLLNFAGDVRVYDSRLIGEHWSMYMVFSNTRIVDSQLAGGQWDLFNSNLKCVSAYDGAFNALGPDCVQ